MNSSRNTRIYLPALISALALFLFGAIFTVAPVMAQKTKQLPPPPPVPIYRPKPTPTPAPEELDVVRVTSNLIAVPVSVTDANGQPVLGLTADQFRIDEDGRSQQIAQLGDPEQVPLDIALLIDVSASVEARFAFEQKAAADFLRQVMKPGDRAAVFAIGETPRFVQPLAATDVATRQLLTIKPTRGFTAFFDTILAAEKYLDQNSSQGRRRVMVVLSDGDDTARILTASTAPSRKGDMNLIGVNAQIALMQRAQLEAQQEVQRAEITFYSINPSGNTMHLNPRSARSQQGMERIAGATGGAAFLPSNDGQLPAIFQRIASEIRSQYLLQYYSDNKASGAAFRRIKVTAPARPELRLRAREGYFPKGQ
ncbi:MAG TPA: VWA domain-containing protein [Pyrinomonadaceae bacterium]|nr:VWA domain-containing protein [Pyrinomonadaceae bacterium]